MVNQRVIDRVAEALADVPLLERAEALGFAMRDFLASDSAEQAEVFVTFMGAKWRVAMLACLRGDHKRR